MWQAVQPDLSLKNSSPPRIGAFADRMGCARFLQGLVFFEQFRIVFFQDTPSLRQVDGVSFKPAQAARSSPKAQAQ